MKCKRFHVLEECSPLHAGIVSDIIVRSKQLVAVSPLAIIQFDVGNPQDIQAILWESISDMTGYASLKIGVMKTSHKCPRAW